MGEISYHSINKETWGDGPWQHEPDKIQYKDEVTGLPCLIRRNRVGSLCGYVGVDESHPWFGKHYSEVEVDVHGGLTYADSCQDGPEEDTICHIPDDGEPDHLWWFDFDCGHLWDLMPALNSRMKETGIDELFPVKVSYKTIDYVRSMNTLLARQIVAAAHG